MHRVIAGLFVVLASCTPMAQQHDHGGGKETLGTVRFEVSCAAAVQPKFNRAKAKEAGAGTPREREYIEALALLYDDPATPHRVRALRYEEAMGKLAARYPKDIEATILYGLAVSANHDLNDRTYERPLKAVAL